MQQTKKWLILIISVAAIAVGVFFLSKGHTNASPAAAVSRTVKAPDFKLKLLAGRTIRLSDFKGKTPVVLNFWASWCPPWAEAPLLAKVSRLYGDKVRFLGVIIQDSPESAKSFINRFGLGYMNGLGDNIAAEYGVTGIPTTVFIDKRGQVIDSWVGAIDPAGLTARINKILGKS